MSRVPQPAVTFPSFPEADTNALMQAWGALRADPASASAWLHLAGLYAQQGWPWHAHFAHAQAQRCAQARAQTLAEGGVPLVGQQPPVTGADCWGDEAARILAQALPWRGLREVVALLQARTLAAPQDWLSWLFLARCLEIGQMPQEGSQAHATWQHAVRQALLCEVITGESGHQLAQWRLHAGDAQGAMAALRAVLLQSPKRYGSWLLQAQAQMQLGLHQAVQHAFERAAESSNPKFLGLLADQLRLYDFNEQALRVRERVTDLTPNDPLAWMALAEAQAWAWQIDKAQQSLGHVLALVPDHPAALRLRADLKVAAFSRAQFERELARFDADTAHTDAHDATRLLRMSLYQSHLSPDAVAALHRRVGQHMTQQALASLHVQAPAASPRQWCDAQGRVRRLRVGYVTADLHGQHPMALFMLPVLRCHDRARVEVFVYHTGAEHDASTQQAHALAEHWCDAAHLDDLALHRQIVDDQIDVLVDLAGHNDTHRLGVFALRAAPAQLSYLGYPHSTGLPFIDWLVADAVVAPPGDERLFSERLARLSGSVLCWNPLEDHPLPPDSDLARGGPVVFGAFSNLHKMDDATLGVWARILHRCPDARLLLRSAVLDDPVMVRRTSQRFVAEGVPVRQLELRGAPPRERAMQDHLEVDIALDTFPFNGATTSLQALWMGCPLISLEGGNFVSRMGASLLHGLGRPEWLASSADDYVEKAVALARDMRQRPWSRQAQRQAMQASALCQIERHTRELEDIYQQAFLRSGYFQ